MRSRWITLIAAAMVLTTAAPAQARAGGSEHPKISFTKLYQYKVTVGTKGGATLEGSYDSQANGDAIDEHFTSSFSADGSQTLMLAADKVEGVPNALTSDFGAVINGTWTDKGTKWVDVANNVKGDWSCGGNVESEVPSGGMRLKYKRKGSSFRFTVWAPFDPLQAKGSECPNGANAGGPLAAAGSVYDDTFTLSRGDIGDKTIVKKISGPANRKFDCFRCTFDLAWHGVVRFKRTRAIKVPQGVKAVKPGR